MSKKTNHWEQTISSFVPYLQWNVLSDGMLEERHNHVAYELYIVTAGECTLSVNNTELTLLPDQGVLIAPEVFHASRSITTPFTCISAAFILKESMPGHFMLPDQRAFSVFSVDQTIRELCAKIMEEQNQQDNLFHKELIANHFSELLLRLLRLVKDIPPDHPPAQETPTQQDDMSIIDSFFRTTPPELRTKENLAKQLHCSERHALRKIYDLYGMSFQKKQILSRIDTAKYLLNTTDKSIEEICSMVGYADKAALYRAFKLYTDTTPIKYRRQAKR